MKKRIGELNGKPIVVGDSNLVTVNEYYCLSSNGIINIMKRGADGSLVSITQEQTSNDSLLDNNLTTVLSLEPDIEEQILNILNED